MKGIMSFNFCARKEGHTEDTFTSCSKYSFTYTATSWT